ncbi:MAG: glycosyl hydrolase [Microbacterium sp.]
MAAVAGTLADWDVAAQTTIAFVGPQAGDAADGTLALEVDAPVVTASTNVAGVDIAVAGGESLEYSLSARAMHALPTEVSAHLQIGDERIDLPELTAEWTSVTGTFDAPADATMLRIEIVADGPVSGLAFDQLSITGSDGANKVPNSSFESVDTAWGIANTALVMSAETAAIAVSMPDGLAEWTVTQDDTAVASGSGAGASAGIATVSLEDVSQGYYTFTATDASGQSVATPIAIIDRPAEDSVLDARFGVGLHVEKDWYGTATASLTSSLGVGAARNDILWKLNETTAGVYDWDPLYADGFDRLYASGIHLLGIVNYGNELYGSEKTPETDEAIAAYGRYAAAIAERFDLVGLEVFNEFNQERFNDTECGTDPTCYIPLLQAVRDNVRLVDPDLPLIAGATARYDADWFNGLWQAGGLQYADAISYHPYEIADADALVDVIEQSRQSMIDNGGGELPVWITELGLPTYPGVRTEAQQATFVLKATTVALGNGVEKFFWYDLINDGTDATATEENYGLFAQPIDGVAANPPKAAAFAYALIISQLAGKESVGAVDLGDGVSAYQFGSGDDAVTVAWSRSGDEISVQIPTTEALDVVQEDGTTSVVEVTDSAATGDAATGSAAAESTPTQSAATESTATVTLTGTASFISVHAADEP